MEATTEMRIKPLICLYDDIAQELGDALQWSGSDKCDNEFFYDDDNWTIEGRLNFWEIQNRIEYFEPNERGYGLESLNVTCIYDNGDDVEIIDVTEEEYNQLYDFLERLIVDHCESENYNYTHNDSYMFN